MKERLSLWERLTVLLWVMLALGAFLISLADIFGLLDHVSWLRDHIATIILLTCGVTLGVLAEVLRRLFLFEEHGKIVANLITRNTLDRIEQMRRDIDPNLMQVVGDEITVHLRQLPQLFGEEKQFVLSEVKQFKELYSRTLSLPLFKRAKFRATSLPTSKYFWADESHNPVIEAHRDFIKHHGEVSRVFFLDPKRLQEPEIARVLQEQVDIGVEVWVADPSRISPTLRRFCFADEEKRVGWEVEEFEGGINKITITTNAATIEGYLKVFKTLVKYSEGVSRFPGRRAQGG
ncbi:MAG TPA: hypothetical protein VFB79_02750 [Candidatus Angelobacter sp.]|nr:hypothetical protein [Candidatus Angelobacter sp.]